MRILGCSTSRRSPRRPSTSDTHVERSRAAGRRSVANPAPARGSPPEDPAERARRLCLDLLDRRPRTRAELATALDRRGIAPPTAARVLDRLTEVGLVDDAAFATAWVATRQASRALGRAALARELRRRGVAEEVLRGATEVVDADAELIAARALVAARLPRMAGLSREAAARRLCGLLARRGYPAGLAARVVAQALDTDRVDTDRVDTDRADFDQGRDQA